eukprot:gene9407-15306_t
MHASDAGSFGREAAGGGEVDEHRDVLRAYYGLLHVLAHNPPLRPLLEHPPVAAAVPAMLPGPRLSAFADE